MFVARTAESSLTRCGLFPVLSSCCIAPTTMSSLMPSVSILLSSSLAGDGGGDSSIALFGFSSLILIAVVLGGLISPFGDAEPCERLLFFDGGSSPSTTVLGGEGCDCVLERLGTVIPSSDSESDFRLVLYGIAGFDCLDADMMTVRTAVGVMDGDCFGDRQADRQQDCGQRIILPVRQECWHSYQARRVLAGWRRPCICGLRSQRKASRVATARDPVWWSKRLSLMLSSGTSYTAELWRRGR